VTQPTAEELIGLYSRLFGVDLNYIERQLESQLEEKLASPEVQAKIREAEEAVADYKSNTSFNDPRLDALGETLPEMMEKRVRAITQAVGEKIKEDYPEYADQIQDIEVSEEDLAAAKERLSEYIADSKLDAQEMFWEELDENTADLGNIEEIIRRQYEEETAAEKVNYAEKFDAAIVIRAKSYFNMCQSGSPVGREVFEQYYAPGILAGGEQGKAAMEALNKMLAEAGQEPITTTAAVPEASAGGMTP